MKRLYPAQEVIPKAFQVFQALSNGRMLEAYLRPANVIVTGDGRIQTFTIDIDAMKHDAVAIAKAIMNQAINDSDPGLTDDHYIFWREVEDEDQPVD